MHLRSRKVRQSRVGVVAILAQVLTGSGKVPFGLPRIYYASSKIIYDLLGRAGTMFSEDVSTALTAAPSRARSAVKTVHCLATAIPSDFCLRVTG